MTRIAFISDIHGNLEALNAVLDKIYAEGADTIICLGDIVGYGPNPKECLEIIREREIQCIKGNHDDYVSQMFELDIMARLRDDVKKSIEWTQAQLDFDDLGWLAKLPQSMAADDFNIVHGANTPDPYRYCRDEASIQLNFQYQEPQLSFCGHSHSPLIGVLRPDAEMPIVDYIRRQTIDPNTKVLVNIGSVGQPRDSDNRACFVFFEYEDRTISLTRVPYDVQTTQEKIIEAGLPEKFSLRLERGK